MYYSNNVHFMSEQLATVRNSAIKDTIGDIPKSGRLVLKDGYVVDPKNRIQDIRDIVIEGGEVVNINVDIPVEKGDMVLDCEGLLVVPGLIDMHVHLGDLFEVSTAPIFNAACDGVAIGLSPGAGNTSMSPSLLGAEIDRGLPMNLGLYLGGANVAGTMMSTEDLIRYFKGECDEATVYSKFTRNAVSGTTGNLVMGIKDHMGHFIMSDENIDKLFEVTSQAHMIYMSHTQDPEHTLRMVKLSKGRPLHLGHASAPGCGTHMDGKEAMDIIVGLIKENEHVSGEFVTSMMRPSRGHREGLLIQPQAQKVCYEALEKGIVKILISDGQGDGSMKGFGDTRDDVPAILELAEMGVLSLMDSVATMTANPADQIAKLTANPWWNTKIGNLGVGALANVTVISRENKLPVYTIVNGTITSFEHRIVRRGNGAGGWMTKFGMLRNTGVGDMCLLKGYGK
ncbi:amidohydrolase family protein [Pyramidobacter sp. YE332]|uniref:amidohydrolase family protein n=1 Tax=unclassified Pyramidobacter TaxID=2632171 RepID=UPI0009901C43|nr:MULTISPECIES: amidohydrolase family protein [unclassified Pyramidobacter]OON89456.1 hydrolase [Pyramidobacter sp. C12-8]WOL40609.1 amidohydrolase family protein [Pyramidobacter sp. YE332]